MAYYQRFFSFFVAIGGKNCYNVCVEFCTLGVSRQSCPPTPYFKSDHDKPDGAKTAASKLRPVSHRLLYPMPRSLQACGIPLIERKLHL